MKRALSFLLAAIMVFSLLPALGAPGTKANASGDISVVSATEYASDASANTLTVEMKFSAPVHIFKNGWVFICNDPTPNDPTDWQFGATAFEYVDAQTGSDSESYSDVVRVTFTGLSAWRHDAGVRIVEYTSGDVTSDGLNSKVVSTVIHGLDGEQLAANEAEGDVDIAWTRVAPKTTTVFDTVDRIGARGLYITSTTGFNMMAASLEASVVITDGSETPSVLEHGGVLMKWTGTRIANYSFGWPNNLNFYINTGKTVDGEYVDTIDEIEALAEKLGGSVRFCMEETADSTAPNGWPCHVYASNGIVDSVYTVNTEDETARAPYMKANGSVGTHDAAFYKITDNELRITGVDFYTETATPNCNFVITFNKDIKDIATTRGGMYMGLSVFDENQGTYISQSGGEKWWGVADYQMLAGSTNKITGWLLNTTYSDALAAANAIGSELALIIRGTSAGYTAINEIQALDGTPLKTDNAGTNEYGTAIHVPVASKLTLDSVTALNQKQAQINFSTNVNTDYNFTASVVIVDNATDLNVQSSGSTPLVWGGAGISGNYYTYGWPTSRLSFELTSSLNVGGKTVDSIPDIIALTQPGGAYAGCKAMFRIEETSAVGAAKLGNGLVDSIFNCNAVTEAGKAPFLSANKTAAGVADAAYIPIESAHTDAIQLTHASLEGQTATLTFSEPVHLYDTGFAFMTNTYAPDPNSTVDFQYPVTGVTYVDGTVTDGLEYSTTLKLAVSTSAHFGDMNTALAKAGIRITDYGKYNADGLTSPEVISGVGGKAVASNVTDGYSDTIWRVFDSISSIGLDSAKVTGERELKLTFSSYINTTFEFNAYVAIVDSATSGEIQEADGEPLKWSGGGILNNNDYYKFGYPTKEWGFKLHDSIKVDGVAVSTIPEIIALTAEGGVYEGCEVVFGITETAGTFGNGKVDTIYNINTSDIAARSPFLGATVAAETDTADTALVKVDASAYTGPGSSLVRLEKVTAVDRGLWFFTLEMKFSEAVNIGSSGNIFYCNYGNNSGGSDLTGNYQLGVANVEYVGGSEIGGKTYSDTVRVMFWSGNGSAMEEFPHDGGLRVTDYGNPQNGAIETSIISTATGKALAADWYDGTTDIEWCGISDYILPAATLNKVEMNGFEATLTFSEPVHIFSNGYVWLTNSFAPDPNTAGDWQFQVRDISYDDAETGSDDLEYSKVVRVQFTNEASFGLTGMQYAVPTNAGVRIVDYGMDGNPVASGNKRIDGYVNTTVIKALSGNPVKATATDSYSDTCWRKADKITQGVQILSITSEDPTTLTVTVTFDRPVHIFDKNQIFMCDSADPNPGVGGSYQTMISDMKYISPSTVGGLEYASQIELTFYKNPDQNFTSLLANTGLRFVEYTYMDADDYTGTVSASVVADANGVGLAATYNSVFSKNNGGSGFWDWYRVDIAFKHVDAIGRLMAAVPVDEDTVRLVFNSPVKFVGGEMKLGTVYTSSAATGENVTDGFSTTWLVTFAGADLSSGAMTVSVPVTAYETPLGGNLAETSPGTGYAVVSTDPWAGVVSPDAQITSLTDGTEYSFMNCDTGRVIAVSGEDEFTLVKTDGINMYYIKSGEKYVDLTASAASLTDTPVKYMLKEVASLERYRIVACGSCFVADGDEGADEAPVLALRDSTDTGIDTGWYLTAAGENRPLRVLPLGDSITFGVGSSDALGYRDTLSAALGGYLGRVVFVGPEKTAQTAVTSDTLNRHAGYPGYVVEDVWNVALHPGVAPLLDGILAKYTPDVTLLMLGANDIGVGMLDNGVTEEDYVAQMARYSSFIDKIYAATGDNGSVIVSAVTPATGYPAIVDEYNRRIVSLIAEKREQGKQIEYNALDDVVLSDISADGIHPTDGGYLKLAAAWEASFKTIYDENGVKTGMTELPTYDELTLEHVYAYNDKYFALKFSDNIDNDGVYWMDIRFYSPDAPGQYMTRPDGSVYQWHLGCSYRDYPGDTLLAWFDDPAASLSDIYAEAATVGAEVRLCLQETDTDYPERLATGYLEGFTVTGDASKKLRTNTPGGWDTIYMEPEICDIPAVTAVTATGEQTLEVTFASDITPDEALALSPFHNVNLTDPGAAEQLTYFPEWYNLLQWRGVWSAGKDAHTLTFTINQAAGGFSTLPDIADITADGGKFDGKEMTFAGVGISGVTPGSVEAVSAEILNDSQIKLTFSEPVNIAGDPFISIRLVDAANHLLWQGAEGASTPMQWSGRWEYEDSTHRSIIWTLYYNTELATESLSDIVNLTGGLADWKASGAKVAFSIEEKAGNGVAITGENGFIENIKGLTGHKLAANLVRPGWGDGVYLPLTGSLADKKLYVESVKAVSDISILVTFSDPVEIGSIFPAMRLVDETNTLVWDGGSYGEGTPMQWSGKWEYADAAHTQLLWTIYALNTYDVSNLTDLLAYKNLDKFTGYELKFCIEENLPGLIDSNGHVDTITLLSDSRVRLISDKKGGWESIYRAPEIAYEATPLISSAKVINDQQIRISFNKSVNINGEPFFAVRYIRGGKLVWSGETEKSVPLQWTGTWEWENAAHTSIIWTMYGGNTYGADNLYDLLNYAGALQKFNDASIVMCIEELGENGKVIHAGNSLVDNVISRDGDTRLSGNYFYGLDGRNMPLKNTLHADKVTVQSVTAVDDMTIEIVFSEPVAFAEEPFKPSIAIRYLTESGDTDVCEDGKLAIFGGTYKIDENDPCKLIWTLNPDAAHGARNLSDIFNFEDLLKFSRGMRIAFCICDPEDETLSRFTGSVMTVTSTDGIMHLCGTEFTEYGASQTDITVGYDLPAASWAEEEGEEAPGQKVIYYIPTWAWVGGGAAVVLGAGFGIAGGARRSKKEGENK